MEFFGLLSCVDNSKGGVAGVVHQVLYGRFFNRRNFSGHRGVCGPVERLV